MHLKIAGKKIRLATHCGCGNERLSAFKQEPFEEQDLLVECAQFREHDDKRLLCSSRELFYWYETPVGFLLEAYRPRAGRPSGALEVDQSWEHAKLYGTEQRNSCLFEGALGEVLFRNAMIGHGGIQIHCAAVAYQGQGVLFSAPSGTGKTTQARLWMENFKASMIQGDRPVIRIEEASALVCGTPWVGSDPLFQTIMVPVKALVFLEQATFNKAEKIDPVLAIQYLLPRCFLPYFSEQMMEKALSVAEQILARVPCYLLRCTPTREAAELLYRQLF